MSHKVFVLLTLSNLVLLLSTAAAAKHDKWIVTSNSIPMADSQFHSDVQEDPPLDLKKITKTLNMLLETAIKQFFDDFLPALSRVRREAANEEKGHQQGGFYLDSIVTGMGALMDRQKCRLRITCNAGKSIRNMVPGAQVAVMLLESLVPTEW